MSDNAKVNGEITTAVSQKVDAIVLAFGTPKEFGEGLAAAKAANVPVFGLDTGGTEDPILVNVTTDNGFLGSASAQAMMDAIGKPGNIAMIVFDAFQPVQIRGAEAVPKAQLPGFGEKISAGQRLITISAGELTAVGGVIKPGDKVDILATFFDTVKKRETTQMILQNITLVEC